MSKNLPTKCYQQIKEILPEKAHKRYQNRSKKKMKKKLQYGREHFKNLSEDENQKLAEYRKR